MNKAASLNKAVIVLSHTAALLGGPIILLYFNQVPTGLTLNPSNF